VGIVIDDLAAAKTFFLELGMELVGEGAVAGESADRIVGLDGIDTEIAMLATPDGNSRIELATFRSPAGPAADPRAQANVPGLRHLCFNVDDIEAVLHRLRPLGAELVREVVRYEDSYLLCYVRGPEGIILELAQDLG
jgi:catechol 2,3-dioxygenase-like lactoylglutathione lyase family enzyme